MDSRQVLSALKDNDISFMRMQFIDIFGIMKNVEIPASQFEKAINGEVMFDGSSIDGFTRIEESDMLLVPDLDSFKIMPWEDPSGKVARLVCDVYMPDGKPFEGCPRLQLKKVIAEAKQLGFTLVVGPEAEFFLFRRDEHDHVTDETHDFGGYFDLEPLDEGELARREIVKMLNQLGFEVEAAHHEVARGQHEVDFRYGDALETADNVATFKYVVRKVAHRFNLHATFMPKPIYGINGSGMHCHQSLFKDEENVFFDENADMQLSSIALQYLAGILDHAKALVAVTNPLVNSYKRLVPGYEAPINIAWSEKNRSPLIRVPARRGKGTRIEVRMPDPACNPYLAFAVMLKAGLDGLKRKLIAPAPVNKNIFTMSQREKSNLKIGALPGDLYQALQQLKKDKLIQEALGSHIYEHFYSSKMQEWQEYISQVHAWELENYLAKY